jgi:outer membrane protein OmpA-like peptidoglycan-associated protein
VSAPLRLALAAALFGAGCATVAPPPELLEARSTYGRVSKGPAAETKPDDLLTAKQQLDRAEGSFSDKGDVPATRDAAYIAVRKALFAEADANTIVNLKAKADADLRAQQLQSSDLSATKGQLVRTQQELDKERTAREEAEKRAAIAMADLKKIAAVKQDNRGLIITLPGGVLFKTDKYELLPAAMVQLNQVADVLLRNSPDSKINVGGFTDAQGPEPHNQELSENRARSVADYLVSRGIARDRVVATGYGPQNPIADNKSIEGRAQNRRVEIVVGNTTTAK